MTVNGSQIIVIPRCGIRSFKKFPMEERKEELTWRVIGVRVLHLKMKGTWAWLNEDGNQRIEREKLKRCRSGIRVYGKGGLSGGQNLGWNWVWDCKEKEAEVWIQVSVYDGKWERWLLKWRLYFLFNIDSIIICWDWGESRWRKLKNSKHLKYLLCRRGARTG